MQKRKCIIRSVFVAGFSLLAMNAYAVLPGFYIGAQLGPATNAGKEEQAQVMGATTLPPETTPVTVRTQQFGSSIFMGYKMNNWAAVEGGFTYFSNLRFKQKDTSVQTCGSLSAGTKNADIVGKFSYTLSSFEVFTKVGAAFTYYSSTGSLNPGTATMNPTTGQIECGKTQNNTKWSPTYGIGASYDLSQNVAVDLTYSVVNGGNITGNIDFLSLGLSYHFVNTYCGQFLC